MYFPIKYIVGNKEWTFLLLTFTKTMFFVMLCNRMEYHAQSQTMSDHLRLTMSVKIESNAQSQSGVTAHPSRW